MSHRCTYSDRLVYDESEKQFYRLITAHWKDKSLDIVKIYEDKRVYARHLTFIYACGYVVDFPGERVKDRYTRQYYTIEEEEFELSNWWLPNMWVGQSIVNKNYIVKHDPSLKYLISKFNGNRNDVLLPIIARYREYPNIEALVEAGQYSLALNKQLQKLSKKKQSEVINFVKENLNCPEMKLKNIFTCIKNKLKYNEYELFRQCGDDKELFKYLRKQSIPDYFFYVDYKNMAIKAGHNFNEPYWKFPKDLHEAHNKVMAECKHIDESKSAITALQFKIIGSRLTSKNHEAKLGKYVFYIADDYEDLVKQANELKQCLITNNYFKKVIDQKSILIFIKEGKKRIGTVEINYGKKILQAYGNESDRSNCNLPKEIMDFAKSYIDSLKVSKVKYKGLDKAYYKGLYNEDTSFNGFAFETGKTYDTKCSDEEVQKCGEKCLATNKVFHFCAKFDDVDTWVKNPASYAIVEPLGPIVKRGNALGSNRIKIKKIMTLEDVARALLSSRVEFEKAY